MSPRTRRHVTVAVAKDFVLFLLGTGLIVYQGFVVPPQDFQWIAMVFGGVLAGVPGALQLWGLRSTSTDGSTSSPELPPSPSPSSSSPSM